MHAFKSLLEPIITSESIISSLLDHLDPDPFWVAGNEYLSINAFFDVQRKTKIKSVLSLILCLDF